MKKIALATIAMISAMTFLASSKQSAEAQRKATFITEKANFKQESLSLGTATNPLAADKSNLAQAD